MEEEEKKIRHTISAEETFTLAKDVFDIRTFIKNVYANRAVIARRINILTLGVSAALTLLYATFVIWSSFYGRLSLDHKMIMYCLIGLYALFFVLVIVFAIVMSRAQTKHIRRLNITLKIFRLILKLISIAIAIAAIIIVTPSQSSPHNFAVSVLLIVFSIFSLIVQIIPLMFGGTAKFVRWLLSPVKIKLRFSAVAIEWYELAISGVPPKGSTKKIAKKYYESIGSVIDEILQPAIGNKYINTIKPATVLDIVENSSEEVRPVLEGVLKSVFAYAAECGYVAIDPCRDLNFTGTVEEKKRKTMKERFLDVGKNIGKKMLDKYIAASSDEVEEEG